MSTYAVPRPNHLWLGTPISPRFPAVRAAAPPSLFLRIQICLWVQSELFQFFRRQPLYPHSCRPARANPPINFHINTAGSLLCELGDGNVCGDRQVLTSFALLGSSAALLDTTGACGGFWLPGLSSAGRVFPLFGPSDGMGGAVNPSSEVLYQASGHLDDVE
jgi:hypothetical protein